MRILIDARMYGLEHSGIGRYIINLTQKLKSIGAENQYIILLKKKYFNNLVFPSTWTKVEVNFPHYTFAEQFLLPTLIKKYKCDIVHFPNVNVPVLYKGDFIVTIHDLTMFNQGTNATTLPLPIYYFKSLAFKIAFWKAIRKSSKIIVPSMTVKSELIDKFKVVKEKIVVTYEGVTDAVNQKIGRGNDMAVLAKHDLIPGSYFFYVGNTYPHKNISLVLKALNLQKKKGEEKNVLAIAGSRDTFISRMESEARRYGVRDKIKILGYVPDDDLNALYRNSIAFVYPSLTEGFGLQGLEAIKAGSLLLASKIPVFKEIYDKWAVYFDPQNVESLSDAMNWVKNIPSEDKRRFIEGSSEFVKKYSWEKMAKETLDVYNSVTKN